MLWLPSVSPPTTRCTPFIRNAGQLQDMLAGMHNVQCVDVSPLQALPEQGKQVQYQAQRYLFLVRRKLVLFSLINDAAAAYGLKWVLYSDVDVVLRSSAFAYFTGQFLATRKENSVTASMVFMDEDPWNGRCNRMCRGGDVDKLALMMKECCKRGECRVNTGFFFGPRQVREYFVLVVRGSRPFF